MNRLKHMKGQIIVYAVLIAMLIFTVYPIYWMLFAGTFDAATLVDFVFGLIPGNNILNNYETISISFNMVTVLKNTFFISIIGTLLSLFINLSMGYAFAKYDFKYKSIIFNIFLVTMFIGGAAVMIPQFEIIVNLGLYNSLFAIILPGVYSSYNTLLARQILMDFPTEIIESGRIDGYNEVKIFWGLVVPNVKPIVSTIAIITFMGYWNSYLWNLVVTSSADKYTLQVALATMYPHAGTWTYAPIKMLGAAISVLPILILFIVMQKNFINSLTGSVKA
ncbi:MAG: carbohydrate ABC transporter permease [Firmicutes bacterium]|nr:carbohydrate ABC transporter permease [Bacillota bacterium]